ncbi:LysM-like peptidoglycan-binding domain-containing protein [Vibrio gallicus]|uniref:LysM-like peptidoglycan-binding domain-containing protein n=1 Tax=Vibrio gallicus TaxID=190897 RepID=UPI0021C43B8E|nr:LysM-like peptidoglycan-binding domain-containing protein [Vibrio gallicus]
MNRRNRSKRHTELLTEKFQGIEWKKLPSNIKGAFGRLSIPLPKFHRRALMILVPITIIAILSPLPKKISAVKQEATVLNQRVSVPINNQGLSEQQDLLAGSTTQQPGTVVHTPVSQQWIEYKVKTGDTLANVFRNNDLSMSALNALAKIEGPDKPLSQIRQGQLVRFKRNNQGQLDILQLENGNDSIMFFRLSDGSFGRSK